MDAIEEVVEDIEECSEGEGEVKREVSAAALGSAERFESYLGARPSEGSQRPDIAHPEMDMEAEGELPLFANPAKSPEPLAEAETLREWADVLPTEPDTLLEDACQQNDLEELLKEDPLLSNLNNSAGSAGLAETGTGEESDGSSDAGEVEALLEEDWKDKPLAERELWERVRPRAVRKEAARVKQLKLPLAAVSRLMKVHPDLQSKTGESGEIINVAMVLLLQAMAQATVRGRAAAGQSVTLADVKQACLNNRELQFMLPLSATLDSSALAITHQMHEDEGNKATRPGKVAPAGQSTLSSARFGANAAQAPVDADDEDEIDLDVVTVQGNLDMKDKTPQDKQGSKRKLPQTDKKAAAKAPRQGANAREKPAKAPVEGVKSIASFFKKPVIEERAQADVVSASP